MRPRAKGPTGKEVGEPPSSGKSYPVSEAYQKKTVGDAENPEMLISTRRFILYAAVDGRYNYAF